MTIEKNQIVQEMNLLAYYLTTDVSAGLLWNGNKSLAFARAMTGAGIGRSLAVIVPFAYIHVAAMDEICRVSLPGNIVFAIPANIRTGFDRHFDKSFAFAGTMTRTSVGRRLARVVPIASVNTVTMHHIGLVCSQGVR